MKCSSLLQVGEGWTNVGQATPPTDGQSQYDIYMLDNPTLPAFISLHQCVNSTTTTTITTTTTMSSTTTSIIPISTIPPNCGGEVYGPSGTLQSPNWPDKYPSNTYCLWNINCDDGGSPNLSVHWGDLVNNYIWDDWNAGCR